MTNRGQILGLLMFGWAGLAWASTSSCGWVTHATQTATNANTAIAAQQIRTADAPISNTALDQCLAQITNLGSAFNFDFPSNLFSSLENEACTASVGAIDTAANTYINQNVQYPGVVQANIGAGQSGLHYTVNNDSSSVANTIWNKAVGPNIP